MAGTQFRGQFEQRVKGLLGEVKAAGNVILFIDEIHTITSAGESEGAMNAGNILKPALSRGEIQVIGATTFTEYRKYIEKDQALERRFQPVRVEEPSVADTLAVMNGIKHYYEQHHHVQVPADVLSATVTLSERYITDRYLPDKAIDLLDEACACCNLAHPVISEYLGMQKELDALKQEEADMETADVNEPIDYERVAERKTRIAKLEAELPAKQAAASEIQVTMDDVAKVIELWTGIPAVKIRESEFAKLAGLENELKKEDRRARRGRASGGAGHQAQPRRPVRPPPSGQLHLCGPHRRGQDRAGQAAGKPAVRRPGSADPSGYERVYGKIRGVPYDRFASGLCGL